MSGHVRGRNRALHSRSGGSTLTREDSFMKRFSTRQVVLVVAVVVADVVIVVVVLVLRIFRKIICVLM